MLVGIALVLAALLGLGGTLLASFDTQAQAEWWVQHTLEVSAETTELFRLLVDAETGQRGYLLAGREEYLEPYDEAIQQIPERLAGLRALTADNPVQQARIQVLGPLIDQKLGSLAETIALHREGRAEAAIAIVRSGIGKRQMDAIRVALDEIDAEEEALLDDRRRQFAERRDATRRRAALGLVAVGVVIAGVVAAQSWAGRDTVSRAARLRAEARLVERTEELDTLYREATVGLAQLDREQRFLRVSPALAELDGVPVGAHVGHTVTEVLPAACRMLGPLCARVLDRGEAVRDLEVSIPDGDTARTWLVGAYPLRTPDGAVRGVGLVVQDLTGRKRAEDQLRANASLLRAIADAVPDGLFARDREHRFTFVNAAMLALMRRTEAEVLGRTAYELLSGPDQVEAIRASEERVMATGRADRVEEEAGPPDDLHVFQAVKVPLRGPEGRVVGLLGVLRDITTERHYARTLERTVNERTASLIRSLASLEQLLYSIAHDLRAPNRAMHSFADLLELEYADRLDERARLYLARIKGAALRNDELIRDLLRYGRLAHADVPLEEIDLGELLRETLHELDVQVRERDAVVEIAGELPTVKANRTLTKQILANLLENALKYVPPERTPRVVLSAEARDGDAILRVEDNGVGIRPEHLEQVFEPFARLAQGRSVPGTGMGLAIVRKAAERMHGEVGVDSRFGEGSCFWLRLPAAA